MNIENMQRLLTFYEAGAPEFRLDMATGLTAVLHHDKPVPDFCGSAGCIAGSAFVMWLNDHPEDQRKDISARFLSPFVHEDMEPEINGPDESEPTVYAWKRIRDVAGKFLDIPIEDVCDHGNPGHALFHPGRAPSDCTATQAAQAIRNMLDGKEPWDGV